MVKKDCFHCIRFRPNKGNICSVTRNKINEYHSYYCEDDFLEDPIVFKMSNDDEIEWDIQEQRRNKK